MIHTSYVPLERPYRIIEYNTTLGIQIGTLVVTKELETKKKDGYSIETHSHPVVSYVNNQYKPKDGLYRSISPQAPVEGVVWDKVEVSEVNTIAREGEVMKWSNFMSVLMNWRLAEEAGVIKDVSSAFMDAIGLLFDWNVKVDNPILENRKENDVIEVFLDIMKSQGKNFIVGHGDMGLAVRLDRKDFINQLLKQAHWIWSTIFFYHPTKKTKQLNIHFIANRPEFVKLAQELNLRIRQGIRPDYFNSSHYDDINIFSTDIFGGNKEE